MKIIQQLNETDFIIRVDKNTKRIPNVRVTHDYLEFSGNTILYAEGDLMINHSSILSSNTLSVPSNLQFSIRTAQKVILPFLQGNEYMQPSHLKLNEHEEDDKYFEKYNLTKPRWKKGDTYPNYAYNDSFISYYDNEKKMQMVALRLVNEAEFTHVSREIFEKFIKPNLK